MRVAVTPTTRRELSSRAGAMPRTWSAAPAKVPIPGVPTWLVLRRVDRDLLIVLSDL
jgi:hypothetical protein